MNILYLAHRIPYPPDKGDKLRAFRQIEHLSKRHRVWCACFVDVPSDFRYLADLRERCEDVAAIELKPRYAKLQGLWSLVRGGTITEGFYDSPEMRSVLKQWARDIRYDAVAAFSSSMAPYALSVPARRRVIDLCDRDSQKWLDIADHSRGVMRRLYRVEGERLSVRELRWIDAFDATILITEAEALPLRPLVASRKLHIVGNGVVLPELGPASKLPLPARERVGVRVGNARITPHMASPLEGRGVLARNPKTLPSEGRPTVGFVGVMNYYPNVDAVSWFAGECWPMIRSVHPTAEFRVVGRSPVRAVRRLGRHPGVRVVGGVEDVQAELLRFDVSVAPLRIARGIQNKVLEAMAAAKPVVLTSKAAAGIGATTGENYLVCDPPAEIAGAVRDLLGDPSMRQRIGNSAREFVAERHRWDDQMDRYELVVTGATNRSAPVETPPTPPGWVALGLPERAHSKPASPAPAGVVE